MKNSIRMAIMTVRLVMRMKVALFFTFVFPVIFLFVYAGIFAHGNPVAVAFMFGPVLTLNIMGAGFWGLGLQSVMQRERGSLRRYRLAPIGSLTIVTSNLLANYLLQIPVVGLLAFCAVFFFHMQMTISLFSLWFLMTAGMVAFAGFGLTLASVANTMQEVQVYNNLVWLSLLFLSGVTIPLAILPGWIQSVAIYLPATYLVSSFQAVMGHSEPLSAHVPEMVVLILSGIFGVLIAWKLFRWEKEEKIPTSNKLWALALLVPFLLMGTWMTIYANPKASWQKSFNLMQSAESRQGGNSAHAKVPLEDFEGASDSQNLTRTWHLSVGPQPWAKLSLISPGANGSQHALRFWGDLFNPNQVVSIDTIGNLALPAGTRGAKGVELWIRGDNSRTFDIAVVPRGTNPVTCPLIRITPSSEWENIRVPVPQFGANEAPGAIPFSLVISASHLFGEFTVDVDEINYY